MPVPSSISDLSIDPAGNYPKGTDEVGATVDDYIRSGFAIQRQMQASEYGIQAANTLAVHPDASTFYVNGTGVDVYAIADRLIGGQITIVFKEAGVRLVNGGGITLPAGLSNMTTLAGDNGVFINDRSGHWTCLAYNRADGSALIASGYVKEGGDTLVGDYTFNGSLTSLSTINGKTISAETVTSTTASVTNFSCTTASVSSNASSDNQLIPLGQLRTILRQLCPVGEIFWYSGSAGSGFAPFGCLVCNGASLSRTTYKDLFDVIGTTYGYGDGSSTFNIPEIKADQTIVSSTGKIIGSTSIGSVVSHTHGASLGWAGGGSYQTNQTGGHYHGFDASAIVRPFPNEAVFQSSPPGQWKVSFTQGGGGNFYPSTTTPDRTALFSGSTNTVGEHSHFISIADHTHPLSINSTGDSYNLAYGIRLIPCIRVQHIL